MAKNDHPRTLNKFIRFSLKAISILIGIVLILFILLFASNSWDLTPSDILDQSLPQKDTIESDFPENYLIKTPNSFEQQGTNQCGGFTSAFVMRHFGQDCSGEDVYNQLDYKLSSGYVLPQAILDYFTDHQYQITLYQSDLSQLKTRVARGNPVIILMGQGGSWQHYAVVVGYDEENIYLFDSLKQTVEDNPHYNRSMTTAYFEKLWNNGIPFFERSCFVIKDPVKAK